MIRNITTSKGSFNVIMDDEIATRIFDRWQWHPIIDRRGIVYFQSTRRVNSEGSELLLHREVYKYFHPEENIEGFHIDHINANWSDNRRENLRKATSSQNQMNRRLNANSKSGHKGISWDKEKGKWRARASINGIEKHLGFFLLKEEAIGVYCRYIMEKHKEFARYV